MGSDKYMYCGSYWQLIEVCDICIPGIKFYQNIKPYIQIHFQMEIKPSTNSAAFIKKKNKQKNIWKWMSWTGKPEYELFQP